MNILTVVYTSVITSLQTFLGFQRKDSFIVTKSIHTVYSLKKYFSKVRKYVTMGAREYFNLATANYLGLLGDSRIEVFSFSLRRSK